MQPLLLLALVCLAAAPASTSKPSTQPVRLEDMAALAGGNVRYVPPPQWNLVDSSPDGLGVRYRSNDNHGIIDITIIPQTRTIDEAATKEQMSVIMGKAIRAGAAKINQELLIPPRVEPDDRFLLKLHDAMTDGSIINDRIQLYRVMGLNLVHVAATAIVENVEESADVHEIAMNMLDGMRIARGGKRVVYGKTQIRGIVPLDWKDTRTDNPNGLVATYTHPKDPATQILVSARIIPKAARADDAKKKAFLDKMVDAERVLPSRLAIQKSAEEDVPGTKFLRHIRFALKTDGMRVDTRYLVVGDVLVSVRSFAKEADADAISAIADKAAADLKPVNE
jgi:hypothetical protein